MNDASTVPEAVSAAIVSDYLRAHPDFFDQNPDVLGELKLAHVSDGAVSLVERQVALLRERNAELRRRLDGLMARASKMRRYCMRRKRSFQRWQSAARRTTSPVFSAAL
jgi:uncharacterized protein YigA (DUF484 family)